MLDHGRGVDLQVYTAVTEWLDGESVRYEVLRHGTRAVSLLCHRHRTQVGLTLWPSGDAEMTWASAPGGDIQHYELASRTDLDQLLVDLHQRLCQ